MVTRYTYDALKRLRSVSGPAGVFNYEYDANGNLKKLIDADHKETLFDYNLDNRLIKKTFADSKFILYDYDLAGLMTTFTNSRNATKNYTLYDENHNIRTIAYSDTTPGVSFTYDNYDRLDTMVDGIGTYDYGYDDLDRLATIDGPWLNDTITYTYNELNDITSMTPDVGQAVTYFYDYDTGYTDLDIGRLKEIKIAGTYTHTYDYTGVNPLIQKLTRPNGSTSDYLYNDPLKRLTEIHNQTSAPATINKHTFTYSHPTLPDVIDTENITTGDPISSMTTGLTTYTYNNSVNQLDSTTNPSQAFLYDDDGNMTQGYTTNGYQFTAVYNAENRLTSLTYNNGSNNYETKHFYSGDGVLARTENWDDTQNPLTMEKISEVRFVRDGFLTIQERDNTNAVLKEYTWGQEKGGGIGGLLNLKAGANNYSYLYDGKGNVMAVLDNLEAVQVSYRYDEFGNVKIKSGTLNQPYKFSTKRYDELTGLSYYGYRFYNPAIGRWMTRDPLGETDGINLYGFVGNNAINAIDPWGLAKVDQVTKGSYKFEKYPGDKYHGGDHWHVKDRKTGKLLGRVSTQGKVITGKVPNKALKILMNVGKIGGVALAIILELADPASAEAPEIVLPTKPLNDSSCD